MHDMAALLLRKGRSAHIRVFGVEPERPGLEPDCTGQAAGDLIRDHLRRDAPCMICRFGRTEMRAIVRWLDVTDPRPAPLKALRYVTGRAGPYWWDDEVRTTIRELSGFFPSTDENLARFAEEMLEDSRLIDVIATWVPGEKRVAHYFPNAKAIPLADLEPFMHADPWSEALAGKKVLVIHPFEESIRAQMAKRELLFADPRMLPPFELKTLKAVQSLGGDTLGGRFASWFEALDWMKARVSETDFDVAIIGAGAYGMPLAAHVKRLGKKAVHMGGGSQILFGIRGKRWDEHPRFQHLFNEHWIRPLESEAPRNFQSVEAGCYW